MITHTAGAQGLDGRGAWIAATVVGGLMQLTVGFFTATAIGLVSVPRWAMVALAGAWLTSAAMFVMMIRHDPLKGLLVPVLNGLVLWGAIAAGETWLGWTG